MNTADDPPLPALGLVMSDELRIEGLKAILAQGTRCSVAVVNSHHARDLETLDLILLDSASTPMLVQAVESLRRASPRLRIIVLGPKAEPHQIEQVLSAGAKGFVSYRASAEEIRMAVDVVLDGSMWAPRKVLANLLERSGLQRKNASVAEPHLTAREQQVLRLLVLGQSNREIAQSLQVDEGTIKAHLARLMRKVAVDNRTALTMKALQGGWSGIFRS